MFCPQCGTAIGDADRFCRGCGAAQAPHLPETASSSSVPPGALPIAPPAKASSGSSAAKVAVIVVAGLFLFIVLAGIVAAIAIPNIINASERGKQKRTIEDIRTVASAVEAYGEDNHYYPDAGTMEELAGVLEPAYLRKMPRTDGWGRPFKYESWLEDESDEVPTIYAIGSAGRDGAWERQDLVDTPEGRTSGFDADIVLVDGAFVQLPAGLEPGPGERRTDSPPEAPEPEEPAPPVLQSRSAVPARIAA